MKHNTTKKILTLAVTTVLAAAAMTGCAGGKNSTQSAATNTQSGGQSNTASANIAEKHDDGNIVGKEIDEINKKSGFYSEDAPTLTDGKNKFKQIKLPEGLLTSDKIHYIDSVAGEDTTVDKAFENVDKEATLKNVEKALINTLDGPSSYSVTVKRAKNAKVTLEDEINVQGKAIADPEYDVKNNDGYVKNAISQSQNMKSDYFLASETDRMPEFWNETKEVLVNAFGGPYFGFADKKVVVAESGEHNRVAIDSVDNVVIQSAFVDPDKKGNEQTYFKPKNNGKSPMIQTSMFITYRLPVMNIETGEIKLSKPFKGYVSAMAPAGEDGVGVVIYSFSRLLTNNSGDIPKKFIGEDYSKNNLLAITNPM